jgi:hypothetical protein
MGGWLLFNCNYQWLWGLDDGFGACRMTKGELGDFSKPVPLM